MHVIQIQSDITADIYFESLLLKRQLGNVLIKQPPTANVKLRPTSGWCKGNRMPEADPLKVMSSHLITEVLFST